MIRNKIIIVEDDPGISKYLQAALRGHDYEPLLASDGRTALEMIASHCPDLLLLDLGLPDMDGSEIIRSVRSWSRMPIIVISARSAELDKAAALDMGADDYLTKPFGTVELLARIRTALRHTRTDGTSDALAMTGEYRVGELCVDYNKHRVYLAGEDTHLTPNEYKIVALLGRHAGQVLTYKSIMKELWGSRRRRGQQAPARAHGQHPPQDRAEPGRAAVYLYRGRCRLPHGRQPLSP